MKVTRIYTGSDGESHFEDLDIPSSDSEGIKRYPDSMKATGILFREMSGESTMDWHNASRRQFVIPIEGQVEITVGDGTKRIIGPGSILLAEDTTGRGHISDPVNNQPQKSIFVTLD